MASLLKTYPGPWKGTLLLACGKCQRKLRSSKPLKPLSRLKKSLRKLSRQHPSAPPLRVLNVPCLKLCPKNAVTILTGPNLAAQRCTLLRTPQDLETLHTLLSQEHPTPTP